MDLKNRWCFLQMFLFESMEIKCENCNAFSKQRADKCFKCSLVKSSLNIEIWRNYDIIR